MSELLNHIENEQDEQVDLTVVRKKAVELRDTYQLKQDLENRLKLINKQITKIERDELPDLFNRAKISDITVQPMGNQRGFFAELTTVYSAKIPDDKRQEAFEWFEQNDHGDLVKSVITINFGMQEHDERLRVMKILSDNGIEYYTNESVHHMTLKAFVKTQIQIGHIIPMDLLGVYIFDEVKIKEGGK
jgi:hypothetical protein